jgi:hypothetical protein
VKTYPLFGSGFLARIMHAAENFAATLAESGRFT